MNDQVNHSPFGKYLKELFAELTQVHRPVISFSVDVSTRFKSQLLAEVLGEPSPVVSLFYSPHMTSYNKALRLGQKSSHNVASITIHCSGLIAHTHQ